MINIVIKLYNPETNVHVRHLPLLHCGTPELAPHSHGDWRKHPSIYIYNCHSIYMQLTYQLRVKNFSRERAELVLHNVQSNLAVEESCICGTYQLFHQQLLSQKCICNNISVQLQPTILLSTWCAVCYVCFIIHQRQILLDNVHSTAVLWGEIECRHTVHNVLLST